MEQGGRWVNVLLEEHTRASSSFQYSTPSIVRDARHSIVYLPVHLLFQDVLDQFKGFVIFTSWCCHCLFTTVLTLTVVFDVCEELEELWLWRSCFFYCVGILQTFTWYRREYQIGIFLVMFLVSRICQFPQVSTDAPSCWLYCMYSSMCYSAVCICYVGALIITVVEHDWTPLYIYSRCMYSQCIESSLIIHEDTYNIYNVCMNPWLYVIFVYNSWDANPHRSRVQKSKKGLNHSIISHVQWFTCAWQSDKNKL
jgi:hypothetical protein